MARVRAKARARARFRAKLDLELELGQPSIAIDSNMVISVSTGSSRW